MVVMKRSSSAFKHEMSYVERGNNGRHISLVPAKAAVDIRRIVDGDK